MKFATPYGAFELKRVYQRNLSYAIIIAGLIHILLVVTFMIFSLITPQKRAGKKVVIIDQTVNPLPPPSLTQTQVNQVRVEEPIVTTSSSEGVPQAFPDEQVEETRVFPSQEDLQRSLYDPIMDEEEGRESLIIKFPEKEFIPPPEKFIPTDELPEPVRMVTPTYPELAKMAGVEGLVWIEAFVDKHGKVKIAKCVEAPGSLNSDIFCESSIQAAMQNEYKPALSNKEPVGVWINYKVEFKLK